MAGTPVYVKVTGNPSSDLLALAAAFNTLQDFVYSHTHKTPTSNPGITSVGITNTPDSGSTGGTAPTTYATPVYDVNTGAAITYTSG